MQVSLHITLAGIDKNHRIGEVEVPEASTVMQTVKKYVEENKIKLDIDYMPGVMALVNKTPVRFNNVVNNGDAITLIRYMGGG